MKNHKPLIDFIARADPSLPAPLGMYVPRAKPVAPRLADEVRPSSSARVLFVGQTGVGKTTELQNLAREVGDEFTVLAPPIDQYLDLQIVGWHDLFVFAVLWASEELKLLHHPEVQALAMAVRPPERLEVEERNPNYRLPLSDIFGKPTVKRTVTRGGPPEPRPTQRFRNSHHAVRDLIASGPAQFWDLAVGALRLMEKEKKKDAVFLFDGLEKLPDDHAKRLFCEEGRHLRELPCRSIITGPLSMSFQPYFGDVEEHFLFTERLRAISCEPGEAGQDLCRDLARRRGAYDVMGTEIVESAVTWGGGIPRQFLQLLANAAHQAITDNLDRVEDESFMRARQRVTERWQYQLQPHDYEVLAKDDAHRQSSDRARLLRLGALIEYEKTDGTLRLGINPLVGVLVKRRERGEARDEA